MPLVAALGLLVIVMRGLLVIAVRGCSVSWCPAARSTAATTLPCVPQRHRFGSSAARTSCSVGSGLTASSAAAATIIPEVQ